jgi:ribonuclease G
MTSNDHKNMVFEKMKDEMANDRTKHNILPLSKFGLMQITRQRVRQEMTIDVSEKCPTCAGKGTIGPSIMFIDNMKEKAGDAIRDYKLDKMIIHVHPFVEAFMNRGWKSEVRKWRKELKCKISFKAISSLHFLEYKLLTSRGEEIPV